MINGDTQLFFKECSAASSPFEDVEMGPRLSLQEQEQSDYFRWSFLVKCVSQVY